MPRSNRENEERLLTRMEMEIMNILWDHEGAMSTHQIIDGFPAEKPTYSTVATFMRIMTQKGFVDYSKQPGSKTFYFRPLFSREEYASQHMREVRHSLFGGSIKNMLSFFVKDEEISEDDLHEILNMIRQ